MTTVVKIGGSLSADSRRLRVLLREIADGAHGACIVVPGGGAYADAVRAAQARDGFDDAEAHRRALDAMGRMAEVFCAIEPRFVRSMAPLPGAHPPPPSAGEGGPRVSEGRERGGATVQVVGPDATFPDALLPSPDPLRGPPSTAEGGGKTVSLVWDPAGLRAGHPDIPETWGVTSDSLALWLAARIRAPRCVLVKSADAPPGRDAAALARLGLVDTAFPAFAARYAGTIEIWGPAGPVAVERRAAA